MKWYIGQKIVCIKTHSSAHVNGIVKGKEFTIEGLHNSKCKCKDIDINVGIESPNATIGWCRACNKEFAPDSVWWFSERWFAPIDEKPALSEHTTESLLSELEQSQTLVLTKQN